MDVTPNSGQPLEYAERKGKAPTSLKVVCILGIIFSAIGLLATPCGIYMIIHPMASNPMMDAMRRDAGYLAYSFISGGISVFMGILLLVSSIGGLRLRPWARGAMNVYAVISIVTALAGTVVSLVYMLPLTRAAMTEAGMPGVEAAIIIGAVSAGLGLLVTLAWAALILIVFNRKVAVNAFKGILPEEPGNYPGEMNG